MSFEGTRFEKLENSIKNELSRKRKKVVSSSSQHVVKKLQVEKRLPLKSVNVKSNSASSTNLQSTPDPNSQYTNDRTIYVQGLPFTATQEDITTFFKEVGEIASVRLPKWHDSGKLKGYGHVEFKRAESATKALDLSGEYLQDRYLTIDRPQQPRALSAQCETQNSIKPAGCRTIFIKNLPYDTTEAEILEQFKLYGPIKTVRLAVWNHTGKLKGFGYVDFKREDSAETAVKKSGSIELKGRKILADFETGAPKGSFKKKIAHSNSSKDDA